jgi:hypothetical protein
MKKYYMSHADIKAYKEKKKSQEKLNNLIYALWGATIAIVVITLSIALFG